MKRSLGLWIIPFACHFGFPSSGLAAPYLPLGDTTDTVSFLDMGSIRAKGDERRVWWITVAKHTPSRLPEAADVVATNLSFDCALGEMRITAINRYLADGKPIEINSSTSEAMPIQPSTRFASMMDAVCDQKFEQGDLMDGDFNMFDLSRAVKRVFDKPR